VRVICERKANNETSSILFSQYQHSAENGLVDKAGVTMRNLTEVIDASLTDALVPSMDVALAKSDLTVI
jgi:hypothetical protein